ncbi:MAG: hypothetical protein ACRDGQ_01795 [Candidatus Limnocylindrales bacterium]
MTTRRRHGAVRRRIMSAGVLVGFLAGLWASPAFGATNPVPAAAPRHSGTTGAKPAVVAPLTLVSYDEILTNNLEAISSWGPAQHVSASWYFGELDVHDDDEDVLFTAPAGGPLIVGMAYTGAVGYLSDTAPGLWFHVYIGSPHLPCISAFTVHDLQFGTLDSGGNGPVASLSLSFSEVCGPAPSSMNFGEIRVASTDPVTAISTQSAMPTEGAQIHLGPATSVPGRAATAVLTVWNLGDEDTNMGTPVISQANPGTWSVASDTCTGTPIVPGASCTVTVSFLSWSALNDLTDTMTLSTSTARGSLSVSLLGYKTPSPLVPLIPNRILDSRSGLGFVGKLVNGLARTFTVSEQVPTDVTRNVPADALAVIGNLTVTGQTAPGYLSLTTDPVDVPTTSSLNFADGRSVANGVVVRLGAGGTLGITYVSGKPGTSADVVFDVTGYYAGGPAPLDSSGPGYGCGGINSYPMRVLDTRNGTGLSGPFVSGVPRTLPLTLAGTANVTAVFGNLTVVSPTAAGYLSVTPDAPVGTPTTSTLNFPAGGIRANNFVALRGAGGHLAITFVGARGATAQVVLDLLAVCYPGGPTGFVPLSPSRVVDSRIRLGVTGPLEPGRLYNAGIDGMYPSDPSRNIPSDYAETSEILGFAGNVTMVAGSGGGWLTIEAFPKHPPADSNVNAPAHTVRANGFVDLGAGSAGQSVWIYFGGGLSARTDVVVDIAGYFSYLHN